jgi:hypothetical protein
LALEFADAPRFGGGFDFVEEAFFGRIAGEQFNVVGPAEGEDLAGFLQNLPVRERRPRDLRGSPRQCLEFLGSTRD